MEPRVRKPSSPTTAADAGAAGMAGAAGPGVPIDVRLMRVIAAAIFALAAMLLVAAALAWLARQPYFQIRAIKVDGDLQRNNVTTLRVNVAPKLKGNFFTLDLKATRAAFEAVPWVRHAVVRRLWPNRVVVQLEEQHPVALWEADDVEGRMVNQQGEVFEANVGDVEDESLPSLSGPAGSSAQVLAMHRTLGPVFEKLDATLSTLRLSSRGSWRAELDTGAVVELGRGSDEEVLARTERFVRTVSQVTGKFQRPLQYADLRHAEGYAVRLKGVTTTLAASAPAGKR